MLRKGAAGFLKIRPCRKAVSYPSSVAVASIRGSLLLKTSKNRRPEAAATDGRRIKKGER